MKSFEPDVVNSFLDEPIQSKDRDAGQIRILIVDDQHFVRKMLEYSLSEQVDFDIVGMASSGEEAIELVQRYSPHIALIDVEMPGIDGLAVTQTLAEQYPQTQVLVLSIHDDEDYIRQALAAGARGYLLKTTPAEELAHAIRFVQRGYIQLGPGLFERLETPGNVMSSLALNPLPAPVPNHNFEGLDALKGDRMEIASPRATDLREWTDVTQDLVNSLPQVWSRGLVYVFLLFLMGLVPWSFYTKLDEVVVTKGILQPKGQTVRLDAPVEAKVSTIFVKEGNQVEKGQPLVEFALEQVDTDLQQSQTLLTGQLNQLSQQELLKNQILSSIQEQSLQNQAQAIEKQALVTQAEQTLEAGQNRAPIQESEKFSQVEQAIAAVDAAKRKVQLLEGSFQAEQKEVQRYQKLFEQGVISNVQFVEIQRRASEIARQKADAQAEAALTQKRLQEQQRSFENLKALLSAEQQQAQTRIAEQKGGKTTLRYSGALALSQSQEQLKDIETRITELKSQITQTQNQIQGLKRKQKQRIVYAPTKGTIFQLPIQHPGAVVRPGELVAQLSPASAQLVLRGVVENKDIGFLKVGLPVNLKFDAFPYENFGFVKGTVSWISPNSSPVGQSENEKTSGSLPAKNSAFTVEVSLKQDGIPTADQILKFKPGQTAQAEIVVRQRRVVDLFLDPFLRYQKGGGKI